MRPLTAWTGPDLTVRIGSLSVDGGGQDKSWQCALENGCYFSKAYRVVSQGAAIPRDVREESIFELFSVRSKT
jgi:hypothetical protein